MEGPGRPPRRRDEPPGLTPQQLERMRNRLSIDRDGLWRYDGAPIVHAGVLRFLFEHLEKGPEGRLVVRAGRAWSWVQVEDVPFVVVEVELPGDSGGTDDEVHITLQDGSREQLDLRTLRVGANGALYARIKHGEHEARFLRGAHYRLGTLAFERDDGSIWIRVGEHQQRLS